MSFHTLRLAEDEINEAARWYADQQNRLAEEFIAEVEKTLAAIEEKPRSFPALETLKTKKDIRRALIDRFPYLVIFEIRGEDTIVLAVSHTSRKPNYWKQRRIDG